MNAAQITADVAAQHGMTPSVLRSRNLSVKLVEARIILARRLTVHGMTQGQIAIWMQRDRSTISAWLNPQRRQRCIDKVRQYKRQVAA